MFKNILFVAKPKKKKKREGQPANFTVDDWALARLPEALNLY